MKNQNLAEEYQYAKDGVKFTVKIEYDSSAESPRDWDNLGKMICFHRRYDLPDERDTSSFGADDFSSWAELEAALTKEYDPCVILRVYMYDHSGITFNTTGFSCQWDSGQVGFILATKEQVRQEWHVKHISKKLREQVERTLKGEVETYAQWSEGEVYGYMVTDAEGNDIDSCWGYYGIDAAKQEAQNTCDFNATRMLEKQWQKV
jgi:hypothetical protein